MDISKNKIIIITTKNKTMKTENRFERWSWGKNAHSIIDHKKDGQVIKVYRTIKACRNNVDKLNNNN